MEPFVHPFKEACNRFGLLDNDTEKDAAMQEASAIRFGPQLRLAFTTVLIYCCPGIPLGFWHKHKLELCRDITVMHKVRELNPQTENQVLMGIQHILDIDGLYLKKKEDFQMQSSNYDECPRRQPRIVIEE